METMTDTPSHARTMAILIALCVPGAASAAAQQKTDASFHWAGAMAAGKTLRIMNVNGSIQATSASGGDATVSAVRKSRKSDPASVEIRVEQEADQVTICAVWPNQQGAAGCNGRSNDHNNKHSDNNDVDVTFTVNVPAGVKFEGVTVNGTVNATGLAADAEITSVNGNVSLTTRGTGSAETVNGDVVLRLGASSWTGDLEAKTVNGSVTVEMPTPANLEVRANTLNGEISSEFPLTLQGKMSPHSMRGTIGNGGSRLELSTVNGAIELKKAN